MMTVTSNGGTGARPRSDGSVGHGLPIGCQGPAGRDRRADHALIFWKKELRSIQEGRADPSGLARSSKSKAGSAEPFDLLAAFDRIDNPAVGRRRGNGAPGAVAFKSGQKLRARAFSSCRRAKGWSS